MNQQTVGNGMRSFLVLLIGQMISLVGSSLSSFALGVWVYQRTNSVTQFTLIALFASVPRVILTPIAGALVDRWDRRWILIISNLLLAANTLVIALLLFSGLLDIWHIYVITTINSIISVFPTPATTAIVPLLVPKEHLGRANGMSQLGVALVQIIAPVLAGFLMVTIQLQGIVVIDVISFFFVVLAASIIWIPKPPVSAASRAAQGSLWRELRYGWTYLTERPGMLALMVLFGVSNFLLGSIFVLLTPLLLTMGDATVLGTVTSIAGLGMLGGSLLMSITGGPKRRIRGVIGAMTVGSLCVMVGTLRPSVILFTIAAFIFLFSVPIAGACSVSLWQVKVAPDVQGRVFALSGMVAMLSQPFSYLVAGPLADGVFEPLMAVNGPLAGSVGRIMGVGPGRGIALMFVVMGSLHLLVTILGYLYPRLRYLEDEVPDAITTPPAEEQPLGASAVSA